jgi:hypothetical protein
MTAKLSKKKEQGSIITPVVEEKTPLLEAHTETPKKQKLSLSIPGFQTFNALMKLRIVITTLFILFTLAILLIFADGYMISAVLILISYALLLMLMVKLFKIKKL